MIRRLVIDGVIRLLSPTAVGSGAYSQGTDRPVAVDAEGMPILPASAIAGVLRGELARLAPNVTIRGKGGQKILDDLFGHASDAPDRRDAGDWRQSRLRVFQPVLTSAAPVGLRDGVGIDRRSRSPKEDIKYDFEVAEPGACFDVRMELELDGADSEHAELFLALGLDMWAEGRLAAGGRTGTGLGAMAFRVVETREVNLADRGQLARWLKARRAAGEGRSGLGAARSLSRPTTTDVTVVESAGADVDDGSSPGWFSASVRLASGAPLLVAGAAPVPFVNDDAPISPTDPAGSDAQPLVRGHADGSLDHPVPGSSVRGALRSRAERIVRTLGQVWSACDPFDLDPDSDMVACGRRPLPWDTVEDDNDPGRDPRLDPRRDPWIDPRNARRTRQEASCPVCRLFGNTRLGGRVRVHEAVVEGARLEKIDHVAVDRFTGGAVDARKFDAAALIGGAFTVTVTIDRPEPWEVALLLLLLRDVCERWVPIGSRGARGYGDVTGSLVRVELASLGVGPLAAAGAVGGDRSGIWGVTTLSWDESKHFLGRDRPWDRLADHPGLEELVRDGLEELPVVVERWRPTGPGKTAGNG